MHRSCSRWNRSASSRATRPTPIPTLTSPNCKTVINGASATTTPTLPIKIVGAPQRADNDLTSPGTNAYIWVMLNTNSVGGPTAGV